MSHLDLNYLIPKLWTKYFGLFRYNMALGIKIRIGKQAFLLQLYVFAVYQLPERQEEALFVCLL